MADVRSAAHRAEREAKLPYAYGRPCPLCGRLMKKGQALDLDHVVPRAKGGTNGPTRITHASCNRSRGAKMGNAQRKIASRRW